MTWQTSSLEVEAAIPSLEADASLGARRLFSCRGCHSGANFKNSLTMLGLSPMSMFWHFASRKTRQNTGHIAISTGLSSCFACQANAENIFKLTPFVRLIKHGAILENDHSITDAQRSIILWFLFAIYLTYSLSSNAYYIINIFIILSGFSRGT